LQEKLQEFQKVATKEASKGLKIAAMGLMKLGNEVSASVHDNLEKEGV